MKDGEVRLLRSQHAPSELRATGKAIGQVERFGNHDARVVAVSPICRCGSLKGHSESKFERGEIGLHGAIVIGITDSKDLARKNTSLGHRPCIRTTGFRLEDRKDNGVAFDEHLLSGVAVEQLLHRLMKVKTEMGSRIKSAGKQVLGHAC